ncbi:CRISPR associated Cys1 family protein [Taylorella asinigenitalis 14/45]|uniref:CRISPR associated Cys1 family protein n=1 Tax=Taylorella asinigenitalis 14/45 TaxID=1091495 RepID=I7JMH0_9BURK|nr:type I-F CRISPR-associated protein Csy1 [Taylorella asinigenitalis]CCG19560.1 CRISPR associated Cys1 family protein [Taylorella asinigenitalis 14/45]
MNQIELYIDKIEKFFESEKKFKDKEKSIRFEHNINKIADYAKNIAATKFPSKFTHPDSKVILKNNNSIPYSNDGYIREGNCGENNYKIKLDFVTPAQNLPYVKFYQIALDEKSNFKLYNYLLDLKQYMIKHKRLPENHLFSNLNNSKSIVDKLIKPFENSIPDQSSHLLKQLIFPKPTDDGLYEYVNISVLSNSPLMHQINSPYFKFSEKEIMTEGEIKQEIQDDYYIPDMIKYKLGGSKPLNISFINSLHDGYWYALSCIPPSLNIKYIRKPYFSFFKECLSDKYNYGTVKKLEKLTTNDFNTIHIRTAIDSYLDKLINMSIEKALIIRSCEAGWSDNKKFSRLSDVEKEFLDSKYEKTSLSNVNLLAHEFTKWVKNKIETNTSIKLEDSVFLYIKKKFLNQITLNWEVFND